MLIIIWQSTIISREQSNSNYCKKGVDSDNSKHTAVVIIINTFWVPFRILLYVFVESTLAYRD